MPNLVQQAMNYFSPNPLKREKRTLHVYLDLVRPLAAPRLTEQVQGKEELGRVTIGLFGDTVPKARYRSLRPH